MPGVDNASPTRPNGTASNDDELAYYKAQYEQLEAELADFQVSSRELESELERDIEASEKRERQLKEKVDSLRYEVDEWKTKYKQAKAEANSAQGTLQKEITGLRDTNRTLQLKLRDIEVANDDYERQARNTTSSLEDLESKYNVAIERGVLLEEEIRRGEQERENLRVENQRLRDELSDLRIEAEIIQEKLRHAEAANRRRKPPAFLSCTPSTPHTPDVSDLSPKSAASSPIFSTPPTKFSQSMIISGTATPPSPPISEASASMRKSINATPGFPRQRASVPDPHQNTRSLHASKTTQRYTHSRTTSLAYSANGRSTPSVVSRSSVSRLSLNKTGGLNGAATGAHGQSRNGIAATERQPGLPNSGSLQQIRGLIGKMQKLEQRVQSAKSRLPAPTQTPPRVSPRSRAGSAIGDSSIPSSVTMRRSSRKRLSNSSYSSSVLDVETTPSQIPRSRPSIGARTQGESRPSSRTSYTSSVSHSTHHSVAPHTRPESRQSLTGRRTPLGHYSTNTITEGRRPRSSMSNHTGTSLSMSHIEEDENGMPSAPPMPASGKTNDVRRPSLTAAYSNGLSHTAQKRSVSGISAIPTPRSGRTSSGLERRDGNMPPPDRRPNMNDLGETY